MKVKVKVKNRIEFLTDRFLKQKKYFVLKKCGTTSTLEYDGKSVSYTEKSTLNKRELNLVSVVTRYNKDKVFPKSHTPQYIDVLGVERHGEGVYTDMVELDLNAAYWNKALQLGYITKGMYEKAFNPEISKKARLVALGSLAKTTYIYENDMNGGVKYIGKEPEKTEGIFFHIANEVAKDLVILSTQIPSYLFYWVDALFFSQSDLEKANKIVKALGYEYKLYICESIEITPLSITVNSSQHSDQKRVFFREN